MRRGWAVALAAWLLLAATTVVLGHAELIAVSPAAGSVLETSPAEIRLTFSEPIASGSQLVLIDAQFVEVTGVVPERAENDTVLLAALPPLPNGVYTVEYDVLSADNHFVRGSYEFAVSVPKADAPARTPLLIVAAVLLAGGIAATVTLRRRP
jgi:copper transport protein